MLRPDSVESPRSDLVPSEEFRSNNEQNIFVRQLWTLLRYDRRQESDRRDYFIMPPPWHMGFRSGAYVQCKRIMDLCVKNMMKVHHNPDIKPAGFHTSSGVISRVLSFYIKEVKDFEPLIKFLESYRKYMRGERKTFPRNVSPQKTTYTLLKEVSKQAYSQRLIEGYRGNQKINTQDFAILYKVPVNELLESVLTSMSMNEVVEFIERYRARP